MRQKTVKLNIKLKIWILHLLFKKKKGEVISSYSLNFRHNLVFFLDKYGCLCVLKVYKY